MQWHSTVPSSTSLLEAATGEVLWAGRFDRPLTELADLQEELVMEVADALYGVSMRGDGITGVVSQRLRQVPTAG